MPFARIPGRVDGIERSRTKTGSDPVAFLEYFDGDIGKPVTFGEYLDSLLPEGGQSFC